MHFRPGTWIPHGTFCVHTRNRRIKDKLLLTVLSEKGGWIAIKNLLELQK